MKRVIATLALCFAMSIRSSAATPPLNVMPVPADLRLTEGRLPVSARFSVAITGAEDVRVRKALERALTRWQERTGFTFAHTPTAEYALADPTAATLVIDCEAATAVLPALGDDESYTLAINARHATLRAPRSIGLVRGLETLAQWLQTDGTSWFLPAATIADRPRFPWRGLMIDVCRHWQPIDVIKRNIDGMALVKLNVLHLHLTEDQGFRIESKAVPQLHERGSDGRYFTQDQMREIIAYAAERGIRVVPEFDIPGHATSWVVAFPELASGPGPYVIERDWGVFNPVLDPTNEATYAMLERFLGEMAALFPDPYLHIGGDENNGVQWNATPRIQAFIREHNLKDNAGLHAYFNRRVRDILQQHGKKLIGWDEVLHPDLPKDSVIHSWRGAKGLAEAAGRGYTAILSNGYYIDLSHPASDHYRNDPVPADTTLTAEQQARILGGEATMWAEWVTPETIDSRIWPRTAAIAERLWSPREVNDIPDMYRRLAIASRRLEEAGLKHESNRPAMIRRFVGEAATPELTQAVTTLVDVIEPVKGYERKKEQPNARQQSPLTGLVDIARPESEAAREFSVSVVSLRTAAPEQRSASLAAVRATLQKWKAAAAAIAARSTGSARIADEAAPVALALSNVATVGLDALDRMERRAAADAAWQTTAEAALKTNRRPGFAVELPAAKAVTELVQLAGGGQ